MKLDPKTQRGAFRLLCASLAIGLAACGGAQANPATPETSVGADASADDGDEVSTQEPEAADDPPPAATPTSPPPPPDYHAQTVRNASEVLRNMQPDFRACYKKRLSRAPSAHGDIVISILIGPDGNVRSVDTTGGAILGEAVMNCIDERVRQAKFSPPHGGGTRRLKVPFSFRSVVKAPAGDAG